MGKWNRRYYPRSNRRSRYRDYDWSPPRETYQDPELGDWQDNVPMWEKKFCFLSGVPWEKVLSTKKFIHCHDIILEWDDTAGKEAFDNAKECYWAKLNGRQCEITPPDPDAYTGEIDWNTYIDPELIKELDDTFFVPDDMENLFDSLKDDHKSYDAWDCDLVQSRRALKDKSAARDQWEDSAGARGEPTDHNNPWECNKLRDSETVRYDENKDNPWERGSQQTARTSNDKAAGWNQWDVSVDSRDKPTNQSNPWEHGRAQNKAAGWNQYDSQVNAAEKRSNYDNSWGCLDRPGTTYTSYGSRGGYLEKGKNSFDNVHNSRGGNQWRDSGESSWGRNQRREPGLSRSNYYGNGTNYSANRHDWGHQRQSGQYGYGRARGGFVGEMEDMAGACRKREGAPGQNAPGHKGPRLQYTDQTSRRWNNGSSNRRVSFGAQ